MTSALFPTRSLPSQPFLSVNVEPLVVGGASEVVGFLGESLIVPSKEASDVDGLYDVSFCASKVESVGEEKVRSVAAMDRNKGITPILVDNAGLTFTANKFISLEMSVNHDHLHSKSRLLQALSRPSS